MDRCVQFRHFIVVLAGVGIFFTICFRVTFVLVLTHTTRSNITDVSDVSLFRDCTTFNNTDLDYINFSKETGIHFHVVYFVGMVIGITGSGHLTSRFPAHYIVGLGTLTTSLLFLVLPVIFQHNAVGVFVVRFLQGFMEGIILPAVTMLVTAWSSKHEKSILSAVAFMGIQIGPGLSNIVIGACLCYISWDSGIYIFGAFGTLWALVWFLVSTSTPGENRFVGTHELDKFAAQGEFVVKGSKSIADHIPWSSILTSVPVWAAWFASLSRNTVNTAVLTLLPQYFKDVFKIKVADIGLLLSVPYFIGTVLIFIFSQIADRLIESRRLSITHVRKLMQCVGVLVETVSVLGTAYSSSWEMSYAFVIIGYSFGRMTFAGSACNMMDLSPQYTGAVASVVITGFVGSAIITLISSFVIGVDSNGANWKVIFWIVATLDALSGVFYFLFASGEKQDWGSGARGRKFTELTSLDLNNEASEMQSLLVQPPKQ